MNTTEFQHIETVNGQLVRRNKSTLAQAAEELAAVRNGRVVFTCPNFAVVATSPVHEETIWAK